MATKVVGGGEIVTFADLRALAPRQDSEAVLYVEQTLAPTQQAQARSNIGVAGKNEVIYLGNIIGTV